MARADSSVPTITICEYPAYHADNADNIIGIDRPAAPIRGPYLASVRSVRRRRRSSPVTFEIVRVFSADTELAAGSAPS